MKTCCCATGGAACSARGKVIQADASGQMRIYSPSVISALQTHLASADPELGAPLENLVNLLRLQLLFPPDEPCSHRVFRLAPSGRGSRRGLFPLGVPRSAGLNHGAGAGGPGHGPDRPGHFGRVAGHRLVHCRPQQSSESDLGNR